MTDVSRNNHGTLPPSGESSAFSAPEESGSKGQPWTPGNPGNTGRFQKGQSGPAKTHGVSAFKVRGEIALSEEMRSELAAFRAGVEVDQGGTAELTTIGNGYVRRLAEAESVVQLLGRDLQERGIFTPRGRMRSTFHAYLQAVDRWDRLAQRLGLERKAKPVDPLTAVRHAVEEANQK